MGDYVDPTTGLEIAEKRKSLPIKNLIPAILPQSLYYLTYTCS
jgi:hypothetical protein